MVSFTYLSYVRTFIVFLFFKFWKNKANIINVYFSDCERSISLTDGNIGVPLSTPATFGNKSRSCYLHAVFDEATGERGARGQPFR